MSIKRAIKTSGRSVRIVPNKELVLNSAQILHNKLTTRGAWELLLVRWGRKVLLAQSIFVQDIEAYAARDQARPARDARVGMLPPKLAQLMINFVKPPAGGTVLDPFCGSGVILQEALLMNYKVVGSDADSRMINFALRNINWLSSTHKLPAANYKVVQADAQIYKWKTNISAVVSEIYLGKPLVKLPATEELHKIAREVNELLKKSLANLQPQIRSGTRLCLAVPLWRTKTGFVRLPVIDHLTDMGYNQLDFKHAKADDLAYYRKDQIVARQLIVLEKR